MRTLLLAALAATLLACSSPAIPTKEPETPKRVATPAPRPSPGPGAADEGPLPYDADRRILGATKSLRCSFDEASRFDFEGGRRLTVAETFTLTLDAIDLTHGHARVITANVALNAESVALNAGGLQVFEEASSGNVFLTTVYPVGLRSKDGSVVFFAARSYHLVVTPGESVGGKVLGGELARRPLAVSLTGACVPIAAQ